MTSQRIAGPISGKNSMFIAQSFLSHKSSSATLLDGSESDGTNLLTGGGLDFSSVWATLNASITANNQLASDGTTTAARILETAADARHGIYINPSIVAGSSHVYSVYAKQNTTRYIVLYLGAGTGTGAVYAYFDLQSGAVTDSGISVNGGTTAIGTPTIAAAVNGYYKCTMPSVIINVTDPSPYFQIMMSNVATYGAPLNFDSPQFAGSTSNGADLWRPKVV